MSLGNIKSTKAAGNYYEESSDGLNLRLPNVPINDNKIRDFSNDSHSNQSGYDHSKGTSSISTQDANIPDFHIEIPAPNNDMEGRDSSEDGTVSSEDSDVEVINAPLFPIWMNPTEMLYRLKTQVWHRSNYTDEFNGENLATVVIDEGRNCEVSGATKKNSSSHSSDVNAANEHSNGNMRRTVINENPYGIYQEAFQGMTTYVFNSIKTGIVAVGNVVLNKLENTLQALVISTNDRTEPP